jgi:hypothetical protein
MEVGQGPNWGCSAKEKKIHLTEQFSFTENQESIMLHLAALYFPYFLAALPLHFLASHSVYDWCVYQPQITVK